jgi:hypothetical protein
MRPEARATRIMRFPRALTMFGQRTRQRLVHRLARLGRGMMVWGMAVQSMAEGATASRGMADRGMANRGMADRGMANRGMAVRGMAYRVTEDRGMEEGATEGREKAGQPAIPAIGHLATASRKRPIRHLQTGL